jgi:hypothetical protein
VTVLNEGALAELSHYRDRGDFDHEWLSLVEDHPASNALLAWDAAAE